MERDIEQALVSKAKRRGGLALKFVSPGWDGAPDRLVLMPKGRMGFVELKAPGKRARPLQQRRHAQLRALGFQVHIVDGIEQIEPTLEAIRRQQPTGHISGEEVMRC